MNLMSFNTQHCLNYIERQIDFQIMAETIKNCCADIVALNEMRDEGPDSGYDAQVRILAEKTGLNNHFFSQAKLFDGKNPYGNGLLSKYPITKAETIMIPDPVIKSYDAHYETRCILKAKLENGITVLVTHFGLNPDEQENAVKTILENLEDERCILMGDFNLTPDHELLKPIKEKMKDTADMFEETLYSFPSDKPCKKIDYIFVSHDIEVIAADIPAMVASDHRPHTAAIKIPEIQGG